MSCIIESYTGNLLRSDELSPSSLYGSSSAESGSTLERDPSNMASGAHAQEPLSKEREEELENWMSEIKSFIRSIDVNRL